MERNMRRSGRARAAKLAAVVLAGVSVLAGCAYGDEGFYDAPAFLGDAPAGNFVYDSITEQPFVQTAEAAESYLSLDRNTAGYAHVRAQLNAGYEIAPDSVRAEELINYFSYDYPQPEGEEAMRVSAYLSDCPWNAEHALVTVGVRTRERVLAAARNNYVFLVDVSGSMSAAVAGLDGTTCLDLVKYGAACMLEGLGAEDTVSIVTYASGVQTALEPTRADEAGKLQISAAMDGLEANGSTNGSGGLRLAYELAARHFSEDGNNRVILLTDGDFNVGISSKEALEEYIAQRAEGGVYLSVIGVGMGNMRDDIMQALALSGNGNYAYIDTPREAEKVLSEELNGMLVPVASDAKAAIAFDSTRVTQYRVIGYDRKVLSEQEYLDDGTDAGEIGSNLCVSVLYEVELAPSAAADAALAAVTVRYVNAATGEREEASATVVNAMTDREDVRFAACVAEFALVLRRSQYRGSASLAGILSRLEGLDAYVSADTYRQEFAALVALARDSGYYGETGMGL